MKKLIKFLLIVIAVVFFTGCNEQIRARHFGGNIDIDVPAGYKVTSATWKEYDLFYFIEPMEEGYEPKEKMFIENSAYGVLESQITFKEKR
jgi:hypothetical protein